MTRAGSRDVRSVTFVSAAARAAGSATAPGPGRPAPSAEAGAGPAGDPAGGWRPLTWIGAPAPGGLALPSARPTASWLYAPRGVYLGPAGGKGGGAGTARPGGDVLVVADTGNHRVLIWHSAPEKDEQPCDVVLGQPDEFSEGPAAGSGDTRTGLNLPTGILMHDGRLVVADAWHHRVLVYDRLPEAPGALPDLVLGQPDLDSVGPNADGDCGPSSMYWPFGVAVVGGRFYVADTGNRRVLGWSGGIPGSAGVEPDLILGQPDGSSREENRGGPPGPASFRWPHAITGTSAAAAGRLYVADAGNHRVLGWAPRPDRDTAADLVLGQPDFTSAAELPYGPQGAGVLRFPYAADIDGTTLAVADTANNRVLLWDERPWDPAAATPDTGADGAVLQAAAGPGPRASVVLGQPDFAGNGENRWSGVTRDSFCWPYGLSLSGTRLAVADSGNNRVVIWERA